jgi:hypothetical protein
MGGALSEFHRIHWGILLSLNWLLRPEHLDIHCFERK